MHPRFHRRAVRVAAVLATTVGIALSAACGRGDGPSTNGASADAPPPVAVATIARRHLTRTIPLTAELRAYQEIDVHAKVAGYVQTIPVDVGDRVVLGQTLATLEIPELQADVQQTDAAVAASLSEVDKAKSDINRATSASDAAHLWATRLANVSKSQPGLVAQQEVDDANDKDRVAAAQVVTAKAAESAAEQQVQVAKAEQAHTHALYDYARITAPFAGVITKRYADTGSMIQAGTSSQTQTMPIVRLAEDDRLRLVIPVPESAVPSVHVGGPVDVRVPVLSQTFTGTISRFSDQVDAVTRMMHTEVNVDNPSRLLKPGMYAEVVLTLADRPEAIAAPVQAIDRSGDDVTVMRLDTRHAIEVVPVTVGLETDAYVEITAGLAPGDLVVVGPRGQLRAGLVVDPKPVTAAGGR